MLSKIPESLASSQEMLRASLPPQFWPWKISWDAGTGRTWWKIPGYSRRLLWLWATSYKDFHQCSNVDILVISNSCQNSTVCSLESVACNYAGIISSILLPGRGFSHSQNILCGDFIKPQLKKSSRHYNGFKEARWALLDKNKYNLPVWEIVLTGWISPWRFYVARK